MPLADQNGGLGDPLHFRDDKGTRKVEATLVMVGVDPQGIPPGNLRTEAANGSLRSRHAIASVQAESYFYVDLHGNWLAIFHGGLELPGLHGLNGLLVQT